MTWVGMAFIIWCVSSVYLCADLARQGGMRGSVLHRFGLSFLGVSKKLSRLVRRV